MGFKAVQAATQSESPSTNAPTLLETGRSAYQNQQIDDAITNWQAAAERFDQQGNNLQQALALSYLSTAYQYTGDWPQAETAIAQSLEQLSRWQARASDSHQAEQALIVQGQVSIRKALGSSVRER